MHSKGINSIWPFDPEYEERIARLKAKYAAIEKEKIQAAKANVKKPAKK